MDRNATLMLARRQRGILMLLLVVILGLPIIGCDSNRVAELEGRVAELESQIEATQAELEEVQSQVGSLGDAVDSLTLEVSAFNSENWREVVPAVSSATINVENETARLKTAVQEAVLAAR